MQQLAPLLTLFLLRTPPTCAPAQVGEAMAAAAPFKEDLLKRGVLVVPAPIYGACPSCACCKHSPLAAVRQLHIHQVPRSWALAGSRMQRWNAVR